MKNTPTLQHQNLHEIEKTQTLQHQNLHEQKDAKFITSKYTWNMKTKT